MYVCTDKVFAGSFLFFFVLKYAYGEAFQLWLHSQIEPISTKIVFYDTLISNFKHCFRESHDKHCMFFYVILIYGVHVHDMKLNHTVGCLRIWTQQINKMYYMLPSMYLQNHPGLMFIDTKLRWFHCHGVVAFIPQAVPDSKIHGANMDPMLAPRTLLSRVLHIGASTITCLIYTDHCSLAAFRFMLLYRRHSCCIYHRFTWHMSAMWDTCLSYKSRTQQSFPTGIVCLHRQAICWQKVCLFPLWKYSE